MDPEHNRGNKTACSELFFFLGGAGFKSGSMATGRQQSIPLNDPWLTVEPLLPSHCCCCCVRLLAGEIGSGVAAIGGELIGVTSVFSQSLRRECKGRTATSPKEEHKTAQNRWIVIKPLVYVLCIAAFMLHQTNNFLYLL